MPLQRIHSLPAVLIDKIAAGEVIEAPYSIIKELLENALDAGSDRILIETDSGGMDRIHIEDNGLGIHADDLALCLERHATSKIRDLDDLNQILSFGFRGEALSTIAAVSHLQIRSKISSSQAGSMIECRGGELLGTEPIVCKQGTSITVRELFYATPARRKYVKSERSENMRIVAEIQRIALANPAVSIRYTRDGKERFHYPPAKTVYERIAQVYHNKLVSHLLDIDYESGGLHLSGFITNENYYRANREGQYLYINKRPVEIKNFPWFIKKSYGELLPPNAHPYFFLFLNLDPARVDVNVHPRKKEVRLLDQNLLHNLVQNALGPVLRPRNPLAFHLETGKKTAVLSHTLEGLQGSLLSPSLQAVDSSFPIVATSQLVDSSQNMNGVSQADSENFQPKQIPGSEAANTNAFDENSNQSGNNAIDSLNTAFVPRRHFGTIFGTYILAEGEDAFYIIDQHTAHERVNFEQKKRELENRQTERQILLTPVVISYQPDEKEQILSRREALLESGFAIEDYGPRDLALRELPGYIEAGTEIEVFMHLIARILEGETGVRLYEEYAALKACKASIKKNDYVAGGVISSILEQLARSENPARCPHGRPTMMKISRNELDKIFHRI